MVPYDLAAGRPRRLTDAERAFLARWADTADTADTPDTPDEPPPAGANGSNGTEPSADDGRVPGRARWTARWVPAGRRPHCARRAPGERTGGPDHGGGRRTGPAPLLHIPEAAQRDDLAAFTARVVQLDGTSVVRLRAAPGQVVAWASTPYEVLATRAVHGEIGRPT